MRSPADDDRSLPKRALATGLVALVLCGLLLPAASAQDDVDVLEELKEEKTDILEQSEETIELIDVATASVDEVTQALDELTAIVRVQEGRLEDAERTVQSALDAVDDAEVRRADVMLEMEAIRVHIADLAVSSFTGERAIDGDDMTELALSEDPGEAARFRHLLQLQTGSLADGLDRLRSLEVEADLLIAVQESAAEDAADGLVVVEARAAELEAARSRQSVLVLAAETQLEARLAEAAFLEERDLELATAIRDQQHSINQRIAAVAQTNGVEIPPPVDLEDIVVLTFLEEFESEFIIEVHADIAEETHALFSEAFEAGLDLAGWGYRPIQRQIELRAAHCGGSEYDIWHKPVFECAPPTARPGFSKHEQGRAIDFTWGGASISTQNNPGFAWLAQHAPKYGFVNLESEPWHWSITEEQ